jgi:hypothetical protein
MWMGQTESRALMILIVVLATERYQAGDYREKLVDVTGFEPATPCLQSRAVKNLNACSGLAYEHSDAF